MGTRGGKDPEAVGGGGRVVQGNYSSAVRYSPTRIPPDPFYPIPTFTTGLAASIIGTNNIANDESVPGTSTSPYGMPSLHDGHLPQHFFLIGRTFLFKRSGSAGR